MSQLISLSNLEINWEIPRKQNPSVVIYFLYSLVKLSEDMQDQLYHLCLSQPCKLLGERPCTCQANSAECTHRWVFNKYPSMERLEVFSGKRGTPYLMHWLNDIHHTTRQPVSSSKYHPKEIIFESPLSLRPQILRQDPPQGRGSGWEEQVEFMWISDVRKKQWFKGWGANSPGEAEAAHMSKLKGQRLRDSPVAGKVKRPLPGSQGFV